jgi:hypothetical protein
VSVGTTGGTADVDGHIALGLADPGGLIRDNNNNPVGVADGRIDLNELFTSLLNPANLKHLVATPSITGSADAKLNNVQATPDIFNLNAALAGSFFDISVPNLGADLASQANVLVTAPAALVDFKKIKFNDVAGGIGVIKSFVSGLSTDFTQIDAALKVAGIKLEDVFTFAQKLSAAVAAFTSNPAGSVQELEQHL